MAGRDRFYTCDVCGDQCLSSWSEEEARAEYERTFDKPFGAEAVSEVCDRCYKSLMKVAEMQH